MVARRDTSFRTNRLVKLGGICWGLSIVFFVSQAIAQPLFRPAYSLLDNRISDLGNTACGPWLTYSFACSPAHGLVNVSFVATGLCLVLGAILTWRAWPRRWLSAVGLGFVILAGLGYILVSLNPENVNVRLHIVGASNLIFSNLGLLFLGLAMRHEGSWRAPLALIMAATGFIGLVSGPLLLAVVRRGGGLAERLTLYPLVAYLVITSTALVASHQPRSLPGSHTAHPLSDAA
jgi:hypothetical membrane protein